MDLAHPLCPNTSNSPPGREELPLPPCVLEHAPFKKEILMLGSWTPSPCSHSHTNTSHTNLFLLLLGLEAHDLQVAAAGDVCHDAGDPAPHAQQGPTQHVIVPQAHALEAFLPLLDQLAALVPSRTMGENHWD